jgi:hypothetical protein
MRSLLAEAGRYSVALADRITVSQSVPQTYAISIEPGSYTYVGARSVNELETATPRQHYKILAVKGGYGVSGKNVFFPLTRVKKQRGKSGK